MVAEKDDLPQQLILDRYRPLEELGEGGFGSVVLAWDTKMQRRVAIKRLPLPASARRGRGGRPAPARDSGLAEARTAALLNHPDIVTVHEWDTDADEAFLIMEHVDGAPLATLLDAGGALDPDEAAAVLDAVFSAVEFAHSNGVLHLDIKPQNVLVSRDGRVKVADFGISALSTATGHAASYGGSLGYMPPEQLRGEPVDERTDVWALGALAFEVLADANPFVSDSVDGALFKIEVAQPSVPSDFVPELTPQLDDIVMTALAPDPAERYPSVSHFAASLMPLLGDESIGRAALRDRAEEILEESPAEASGPSWDRVGLWDRSRPYATLLARALAAVASGWMAWLGLSAMGLSRIPSLVGSALAAVAGVLAPPLGIALGLLVFWAGLVMHGAYLTAAALLVFAATYWWFVARRDAAAAILPLSAPVLGVAHLAPATPLIAGFVLAPVSAALASLAGGALGLLAWAASGRAFALGDVDWHVLANPFIPHATTVSAISARLHATWTAPSTYVVLLGWAAAGAVMSLACRRASRPAAVLGAALSAAALWAGYVLAGTIAAAGSSAALLSWETVREPFARQMTASLILVVLVIAAGPPVRAEEE